MCAGNRKTTGEAQPWRQTNTDEYKQTNTNRHGNTSTVQHPWCYSCEFSGDSSTGQDVAVSLLMPVEKPAARCKGSRSSLPSWLRERERRERERDRLRGGDENYETFRMTVGNETPMAQRDIAQLRVRSAELPRMRVHKNTHRRGCLETRHADAMQQRRPSRRWRQTPVTAHAKAQQRQRWLW